MNGARAAARTARSSYLRGLRRYYHGPAPSTNGLQLSQTKISARNYRIRGWPLGSNALHNLPAVRNASFARVLPRLAMKLVRIPAMAGGAMLGGLAYLQYQATQASTYAKDTFFKGWDAAGNAANNIFSGARNIADQTQKGWENTKDSVELPTWLQQLLEGRKESSSGGGGGPQQEPPSQSRATAAALAGTGAAFGYAQSPEEDQRTGEEAAKDDQMMLLTKKMIEIRSILQMVGQSDTLTLPSIVVIGSQSTGKSSVLEAIVGHEFLPKGSNMVTRRPIELTLVSTPDAKAEYGEFPALGMGKITDFAQIQKILTDLNLAVPASDCVSDDPIQLTISSPNVPDLSLIDLPGYIQVPDSDQPPELQQKILDLCDRYIQPPNLILAISAANDDLANSNALNASRRVDPRGERTIGVITKMDLVDPQYGASMLTNRKYPLRLGYVGVVSRIPPSTGGLFTRGSGNITSAITKNENAYFSAHPLEYGPTSNLDVGTSTLRRKLMHVLEQTMAASLQGTSAAVQRELEEATYEFKVQYNDQPLSAASYLAESLDAFKHSFKEFTEAFGQTQVSELLKAEVDQRVLDLLAQRYWNKPITDMALAVPDPDPLSDLPKADPQSPYWQGKLDASASSLLRLGIGRLATTAVTDALYSGIDSLIVNSRFSSHPFVRQAITDAAMEILNERFYSTSDQVERYIKPLKFVVDVDEIEWAQGRANITEMLKKELTACEEAVKSVESQVGGKRKLKDVMSYIERVRKGEVVLEGDGVGGGGGFSASLLAKGREALFLRTRADLLDLRLAALKSHKSCKTPYSTSSKIRSKNKYICPEPYLNAMSNKLVSQTVLSVNAELLMDFYSQFPRQLDRRLSLHLGNISMEEVERFAREDPQVARHLDVMKRKELLELALSKMEGLKGLDDVGRGPNRMRGLRGQPLLDQSKEKGKEDRKKGWFL